jgi:hypothetical protein
LNPWGTCEDKLIKIKDKSKKLRNEVTKPRKAGIKVEVPLLRDKLREDPASAGEKDKRAERRSFVFIATGIRTLKTGLLYES